MYKFLGDMMQSNIYPCAVSHSGAKDCKRCCVMGTTVAPDGTSLKAARRGGVHHCCPTETIDAESNPEYSESLQLWNYLTTDSNQEVPHFNRELAATMLVSDQQQAIRARTADGVKAAAQERLPLPEREALSFDDHVAGAVSHMHCNIYARQVHCKDNIVCICGAECLEGSNSRIEYIDKECRMIGCKGSTVFSLIPHYFSLLKVLRAINFTILITP
jgi:hypothetical protein